VRTGEPLLRVVLAAGEQRHELDDELDPLPERIAFLFERNRPVLRLAQQFINEGEKLAGQQRYEEALAQFAEAERVDSFEPHSHYLVALTLLELKRYAEALGRYRIVERLAPGWFHCRADIELAAQLAAGTLPHAAFAALRVLEDGALPPAERMQLAEQAARSWDLPAAYLAQMRALAALGRTKEALAAARQGLKRSKEPDLRSRIAAMALQWTDGDERAELLRIATDPGGNLIAAAQARVIEAHRPPSPNAN
jgi:tetratricopeptide (TPR) repeat protein